MTMIDKKELKKRLRMRCTCGAERATDCDKCGEPTCSNCLQLGVEKASALTVNVYHIKCAPMRFKRVRK